MPEVTVRVPPVTFVPSRTYDRTVPETDEVGRTTAMAVSSEPAVLSALA